MILDSELRAFGHYEINNEKIFYKNDLFDRLKGQNPWPKVKYVFNDEVYSCFDWTKEPDPHLSLAEYYRQRAQQLRDNYDYLILSLSGGPDSMNVLDAFLSNNIRLDEIVNVNSFAKTQNDRGLENCDFVYNTKPRLESMLSQHKSHVPKITIIDEIEMTQNLWQDWDKQGGHHEVFTGYSTFAANNWIHKALWVKFIPHIWNRITSGQKVAVIYGSEKTNLHVDPQTGKHCTTMFDVLGPDIALALSKDKDIQGKNIVEWFYHTPNMPQLWIKQAQVLKKYVDQQGKDAFESIDHYNRTSYRPASYCYSKRHPGNLKYDLYHRTVYPNWRANIVTPKPAFTGTRWQDTWWVSELPKDLTKAWRAGFTFMLKNYRNYLTLSQDRKEMSALPLMYTQKYYLE